MDGVGIGHWTDPDALTGCTVVLLPAGSVGSYEMRGGAPAARETGPLEPEKAVAQVDAVVLTGGSAYGLAAADGVMRWCEEHGRGVPTPAGRVPIVPAMGIFDLSVGAADVRPGPEHGYAAAGAAQLGLAAAAAPTLAGPVGAGTGAMVGHWRGPEGRRPGGLGHAVARYGEVTVAALAVVNAFGDIDPGDAPLPVGALDRLEEIRAKEAQARGSTGTERAHTTIGVVVTNARLDKVGCRIVAQGAHDGLARALTPPHTRYDGDGFVAAATGQVEAHVDVVRLLALDAVCRAIRSLDESPNG